MVADISIEFDFVCVLTCVTLRYVQLDLTFDDCFDFI